MATDSGDQAIVQSINDAAHSLGKKTIAEYVENTETLQYLYASGVDFVQSPFVSPPLDVAMIGSLTSLENSTPRKTDNIVGC